MHPLPENLLKEFLEEKYDFYNNTRFNETDPVQIPHLFQKPEDIEIAGFLTATIAWGQRKAIIANARKLMSLMGDSPYDFVMHARERHLKSVQSFVHRTFQGDDCLYFIRSLQNIYHNHKGLQGIFLDGFSSTNDMADALIWFRRIFFEPDCLPRTFKHVSDITKGASAKRLNMFLRWMIRNDNRGVDFGLWKGIPASALYLPLDVHSANVSRQLGLLERKQNDWKAVLEVTSRLRSFDPADPVKYDFALFGTGVSEKS